MSDQHYYQYAFARPCCSLPQIGPGVDPRFEVELLCSGAIAAVVSRVGLDQFDVERLQGKTAEDIGWLNRVAIRHNQIIQQAASSSPVLPLRLGTIFRSPASLLATATRHQETVAAFLETIGDRQEWAVKLYLGEHRAEKTATRASPSPAQHAPTPGAGTEYLQRRRAQLQLRRESSVALQEEIQAVENHLKSQADRCCRVRPLPASLTGRPEKMLYNTAFLLPPSGSKAWLATVERIRQAVRRKGLLLEVTGPWPPYHFCPTPQL